MAETLSATEAAARIHPADEIGLPLGTGQPPTFFTALGKRDDWENLRIYGALLLVDPTVFGHDGVHYLSGFYGPIERALRDQGANISFAAADFRRLGPLLREENPRVMATAAAPPDDDGWCSLSLHWGGTGDELHRAGADPERLLIVEVSPKFPSTMGLGEEHRHALHMDEIDVLVESDAAPFVLPEPEPNEIDRAIAECATEYITDGATLQTGIGAVPSTIASLLAESEISDLGIHSEMFTTGLMRLHKAGKVSNACKGVYEGVSISTFAGGTEELYEWLHDNEEVAFLPVEIVNSPEVIGANNEMVTINGAIALDIHGQVIADTVDAKQFSGVGGHMDFVAGPAVSLDKRSLLCLPATAKVGGKLISRIVPWFGEGAVITTPRHQVDVIVTEYGAAELQGKTVHQRGEALAKIAHPDFRDELLEAAERASGGFSPLPS